MLISRESSSAMPFPIAAAAAVLAQHVRENSKKYQLPRFELPVRVDSPGLLTWLRAQDHPQKLYFRDRNESLQVAAVGFISLNHGKSLQPADRQYLHSLLRTPKARIYGAQRFDDGHYGNPAPFEQRWSPFDGYVFVLPAIELIISNGKRPILAVNMLSTDDAPVLLRILAALSAAPLSMQAPSSLTLPRAVDVEQLVSYSSWCERMKKILEQLKSGAYSKIVLARAKKFCFAENTVHNPLQILSALDESNKRRGGSNGYLFCLQLENNSSFLGCSPERLFHVHGANVHTAAIAGTVRREHEPELWNAKNVREHNFVVTHISDALSNLKADVSVGVTKVLQLPRLLHLATPIEAKLSGDDGGDVFSLLESLHPTPAVCGMPREKTRKILAEIEHFDRGLFAGPFGWFSRDEAEFCVAIRSALIDSADVIAYAGSGIVEGSEARSEWDETELKMTAFTDLFSGDISLGARCSSPPSGTNGVPNGHTSSSLSQIPAGTNTFDPTRLECEPNLNTLWGGIIADELCRCGVNVFFISPGSRSAPLAIGAIRAARGQIISVHDERSAAFMAIGYARATQRAGAVITSSGTAVANLLPAIVEAHMDNLPLILLTADRPPELRDIGANQSIIQPNIFGTYVNYFADLPCPTDEIPARRLLSDIDHAVFMSGSLPVSHSACNEQSKGPVHLNFMFRENLAPDPQPWNRHCLRGIKTSWKNSINPLTTCGETVGMQNKSNLVDAADRNFGKDTIFSRLNDQQDGIILVAGGPGSPISEEDNLFISLFARTLNWPVVADVTSGIRFDKDVSNLICYADQILATDKAALLMDDKQVIVQFGERFVSKRIAQLMLKCLEKDPFTHIIVTPRRKRSDASLTVTHRVLSTPTRFISSWFVQHNIPLSQMANADAERLSAASFSISPKKRICKEEKLRRLLDASKRIDELLTDCVRKKMDEGIQEPWVARTIISALPSPSALFLGNSMPIRDVDMFGGFTDASVIVGANRGASGIDGIVSTGMGFALGHNVPTVILLGDISFLHDLNALHCVRAGGDLRIPPLTVIVVNNGGGTIFSMLPIAKHHSLFSPAFDTPHSVTFNNVAKMFGLQYVSVSTIRQLEETLKAKEESHRLVEVRVEGTHSENATIHQGIRADIKEAMAGRMENGI